MGHLNHSKNDVYHELAHRLEKNPAGAPLTPTLIQILKHLYGEREAEIGSKFPLMPCTFEDLQKNTELPAETLQDNLQEMSNRGLVIEFTQNETTYYLLSPMVVGFFEYTFMRSNEHLPMQELASLFEQYLNEEGVPEEVFGGETKMFKARAYERLMPHEVETEVLNYEKASEMIRDAGGGALSLCSCRHKATLLGKNCDTPLEVCTSIGYAAEWLIARDLARPAGVDELLRVLEHTEELGLVHLGDNVRKNPAYICHCCSCCCGVLRAINEAGVNSVQPSNFIPYFDKEKCNGCGKCAERCPVDAIEIVEEVPGDKKSKQATLQEDRCLGCGVCIDGCRQDAVWLSQRKDIYVPPKNKTEQLFRIAMEKGKTLD